MRNLGPFFGDVWRLTKPYFMSEERWSARLLLITVVLLRFSIVGFDVVFNFWGGAFNNALVQKDFDAFVGLFLTWHVGPGGGIMPGFVSLATVYIGIQVLRVYLVQLLQLRWRRWMTLRLTQSWLSGRAHYRLSLKHTEAAADNPDQRIAEDVRAFIGDATIGVQGILYLAIDFVANLISLASFIAILWSLSGPLTLFGLNIPGYMLWLAIVYAVIGTVATHLVGRKLSVLNFVKQKVEANFRFALVRTRENAEGIALLDGERREASLLGSLFAALAQNWRALMRRTLFLNIIVNGYAQAAVIFPYVMAAPTYFAGRIDFGGLQRIVDAFSQVQSSLSWFVNQYDTIAQWRATVDRLTGFQRAIDAAGAASQDPFAAGVSDGYRMHDATVTLPTGEVLLERSDLTLTPGQSVLLTGRSGSGKSTLFRALAGIWPFGHGEIRRPSEPAMFLPQKPYVPIGTLRDALTYPAATDRYSDEAVRKAMSDAGLAELAPRLDIDDNWAARLSGGELQRLSVARALLVRPAWLFLDEATSNLDTQSEADLYGTLKRELPQTTIVSIAHRPSVAQFHERALRFERSPGRIVEAVAERPAAE